MIRNLDIYDVYYLPLSVGPTLINVLLKEYLRSGQPIKQMLFVLAWEQNPSAHSTPEYLL